MLETIKENLIVNMQIDCKEGQEFSDDKDSKSAARLARRQFKEGAELVMDITREQQSE